LNPVDVVTPLCEAERALFAKQRGAGGEFMRIKERAQGWVIRRQKIKDKR
jgi:hypothetical protein